MPKIALDTIRSLINYSSYRGIEREILLNLINLTEAELSGSQQQVSINQYEHLYAYLEKHSEMENIGFQFGQAIEPDRWGLLGYIAFTSPDLNTAIENQKRYQSLVGNLGNPIFETEQNSGRLKWLPSYQCSRHTVEEIITGWFSFAKKLSIKQFNPNKILFRHAITNDRQQNYQDYFGCEVEFNCDFNGIEVPRELLQTKLNQYDLEFNQLLCQKATLLLDQMIEASPVKMITEFVIKSLPSGVPEIELVAKNLHLSVRTLQRKLNDHQLTFSRLVAKIRREVACSYLIETDTKIVQIAQMLGFSEQSAFQRAFKRWTGSSPLQFRLANKRLVKNEPD
jgi:AraC-like DNA-binding protein